MSTHNIPFSIYKGKSAKYIPNLQLSDLIFSKGHKAEFETAVVNKPLAFYRSFTVVAMCNAGYAFFHEKKTKAKYDHFFANMAM